MKVLQFGQGNFLRTFADVYFETLNQEGLDYQVYVATAIPHENLEAFRRQGNRYHVVLRGSQGGQPVEQVLPVTCLQEVIDPFLEPEAFYALAEDPELKLIVSNTTEAGIQFHSQDSFEGFADITFPAKVTKFLYRRFQAGQPGIYLLPVELIDDNAGELARCVEEYITLWGLPQEFRQWNQRENFYCNTLVDRIVSGYPREEETRRHLENLVGQEDSLLAVGEPFGLWVIERKGDIAQYIPQGTHQIDVVLAEDISYYKRRKVRVLNGSHTNLVAAGLWEGCSTVYGCVGAPKLRAFVLDTLEREIVPFVSQDVAATREFAASVLDRFASTRCPSGRPGICPASRTTSSGRGKSPGTSPRAWPIWWSSTAGPSGRRMALWRCCPAGKSPWWTRSGTSPTSWRGARWRASWGMKPSGARI